MTWNGADVHYHAGDPDALILDSVRPLFAAVGDQVDGAYFLRHWKRGPHVRLRFDSTPEIFGAVVRPALQRIVGDYLAAHPAADIPDPASLMPLHQRLAELERESGPLTPWHPNNSIQPAEDEPRSEIMGGVDAADLVSDFYAATTDLTFEMIAHAHRANASRMGIAFDLMIATAHAFSDGGIRTGFVSFRSHAEAFLDGYREGRRLRPMWDRHYEEKAAIFAHRVPAILASLDGRGSVPFVREWTAALTPIRERAAALVAEDRLSLNAPWVNPDGSERARPAGQSAFNQALHRNENWLNEIQPTAWFTIYRVVLNCTYLHLTRIGISPAERFLLCHLAANAVEDAYGVSAREMIRA